MSWSFELSHELSELNNQNSKLEMQNRTRNKSSILKTQRVYLYIETASLTKSFSLAEKVSYSHFYQISIIFIPIDLSRREETKMFLSKVMINKRKKFIFKT